MRWSDGLAALLLGALVAGGAMVVVRSPGYMDADYYFATARQISAGRGFTEPFLWNYLDDPNGLPHPSHLYWPPLTSLVAALPLLWGVPSFRLAQVPFLLLAVCLPVVSMAVGRALRVDGKRLWLVGCLAAFSGFFLPYLVTTDSFALYALLGTATLWSMAAAVRRPSWWLWLGIGGLIGLCHLTRADGLLFLFPAACAVGMTDRRRAADLVALILGYVLLMSPWWLRNLSATGSVFPPGTSRTLWLLDYDELFAYPASLLTPGRWWASGLSTILIARVRAVGMNLESLLGVNGLVFLGPLMAIGAWRLRREPIVRLTAVYLVLLMGVMSLVFPFAGARGGFFHSSSAIMPVLWALAVPGLEAVCAWGARRRGWQPDQAFAALGLGAVLLAGGLTAGLTWRRAVGDSRLPVWQASERVYQAAAAMLQPLASAEQIVAVNNPAGFNLASGVRAVVIPDGGSEVLRAVVTRYGVEWVILERNHPRGLDGLYADHESLPWLDVAAEIQPEATPVVLFQVNRDALSEPP
jgi:hypothetical protein